MPKTIDILIGVSLVMLVVSLAVTGITQAILAILKSRGRNLKNGLSDLLRQVSTVTLDPKLADKIADAVLTHPMVSARAGTRADVIHREEFTHLMMDLASGHSIGDLEGAARDSLTQLLRSNGIGDPAATLRSIRLTALELERTHPELAEDVRHSMALIQNATSDLVAKVNTWFDRTMDRVGARFTLTTRIVTLICALGVSLVMQLDTFALINGLSVDDQLRSQLVAQANVGVHAAGAKPGAPGAGVELAETELAQKPEQYLKNLSQFGIIQVPRWDKIQAPNEQQLENYLAAILPKLPGILLSTLLLSLGAPFWYNALSSLLRLRSALAEKDDAQRDTRQSAQAPPDTAPAPPSHAPEVAANETGDLAAA